MTALYAARQRIETIASESGFAKVGVARADRAADANHFMQWLESDYHGSMQWLARKTEWRLDPREYFPGCRSIIVVADRYWTGPGEAGPCGRISNYAWGTGDYHDHLLDRLRILGEELDTELGSTSKAVVDTAPVLEKYWAVQAGIGWLGKHTNVLSRELGSWFFLGVLLTTAELKHDSLVPNHCGTCTACLDACPTQAFPRPYVLDASRCISYLTIEHRGVIEERLRTGMGDHVFGCDDCQDVCPWNDQPFEAAGAPYLRDDAWTVRRPEEVFTWSPQEFNTATRGTPVHRAKRAGLARNLAIALGNRGVAEDAAALAIALGHDDAVVREAAAWALGRIGGPAAIGALETKARTERDATVQVAIATALDRTT